MNQAISAVQTRDDVAVAQHCVERLWPFIVANKGPRPGDKTPRHIRGVFTADELATWTLPIDGNRAPTQGVALAHNLTFERPETEVQLHEEYRRLARTRVYECLSVNTGGWYSGATLKLAQLARCPVVATIYQSSAGDATLGTHMDMWYGVVVQVRGSKTWHLKYERDAPEPFETIILSTGDVLLLPLGVWHDVSTPKESVHLLFAIETEASLTA